MSAPLQERRALVVLLGVIFLNIAGFGLVIPAPARSPRPGVERPGLADHPAVLRFSCGQFRARAMPGASRTESGRRPVLVVTIAHVSRDLCGLGLLAQPSGWPSASASLNGFFCGQHLDPARPQSAGHHPRPSSGRRAWGSMGAAFSCRLHDRPAPSAACWPSPASAPKASTSCYLWPPAFGLASAVAGRHLRAEHKPGPPPASAWTRPHRAALREGLPIRSSGA